MQKKIEEKKVETKIRRKIFFKKAGKIVGKQVNCASGQNFFGPSTLLLRTNFLVESDHSKRVFVVLLLQTT